MVNNKKYKSPFLNLLIKHIFTEDDFFENDEKYEKFVSEVFDIIVYTTNNTDSVNFIDFDIDIIDDDNNHIRIVTYNLVTALWFHGIAVLNPLEIIDDNFLIFNGEKFMFDETENILIIEKIDDGK